MPPSGSGKDKILYTEAVGLVMIDYGDAVVGGFGKSTSGASFSLIEHGHGEKGKSVGAWDKGQEGEQEGNEERKKLITRGQSC
jgi:hypothetical protein